MKEVKRDVEEVEEVNQVKGERSEAVYAAAVRCRGVRVWGVCGTGYVVRCMFLMK
ncbi:MAG: hypothetical protein H6561_02535 [Lewinellaceae bacterium]|nr:hypothetical protein [Lewinellaceae bacterium]